MTRTEVVDGGPCPPCCGELPPVECTPCDPQPPPQVLVDLSAWTFGTNFPAECGSGACNTLPGAYVCDHQSAAGIGHNACEWYYSEVVCSGEVLGPGVIHTCIFQIRAWISGSAPLVRWALAIGFRLDPPAAAGGELTFQSPQFPVDECAEPRVCSFVNFLPTNEVCCIFSHNQGAIPITPLA